ncbi:hypothetical protein BT96DRAFT_976099 [Gymnopus androsaceus JB14]|uniref:Uncharacterized protein n=1 Tax=Gymnopus androsaceus JB14 TaxID=1447944 RepID=A0A6A4HJM4_9AGAR|nr:hypothetical protein BT96DRAFT_976099 [Gymnopus androsaceus JB14]
MNAKGMVSLVVAHGSPIDFNPHERRHLVVPTVGYQYFGSNDKLPPIAMKHWGNQSNGNRVCACKTPLPDDIMKQRGYVYMATITTTIMLEEGKEIPRCIQDKFKKLGPSYGISKTIFLTSEPAVMLGRSISTMLIPSALISRLHLTWESMSVETFKTKHIVAKVSEEIPLWAPTEAR